MTFNKQKFFDVCRKGVMGPSLDNDEVTGAETIITEFEGLPLSWVAYALGTAWHETAHSMLPCKERGGDNYFFRMYDMNGQRPHVAKSLGNNKPGDGVRYCGRGYPQLTGRNNYAWASKFTGIDLIANPDLLMKPDLAAQVMREGMVRGAFTGKSFNDFLPKNSKATASQFYQARKIINGLDRANVIAQYALAFQSALEQGGWSGSTAPHIEPQPVASSGWKSFLPGFLGGK